MIINRHDIIVYHVIGSAELPNNHVKDITIEVSGVVRVSAIIKK